MATSPSDVRAALTVVTAEAVAETQAVANLADSPAATRAALFAAVPIIVPDYADAAGSLALDWFEELRADAAPPRSFAPRIVTTVNDDDLTTMVATTTRSLYEIEQGFRDDLDTAVAQMMSELEGEIQKAVASGFWDTMTENSAADPDAVGWRRYARPGACKFCKMLAGKGAVYSEDTARFAAHASCHCLAGPSYDPDAPKATAMQYVASKKRRTAKERAALRAYLNQHFPDARG